MKDGTFTVDLAFDGAPPADLLPGQALEGRLSLGGDQAGPAAGRPLPGAERRRLGDGGRAPTAVAPSAGAIKIGRRNAEQVEVLAASRPASG